MKITCCPFEGGAGGIDVYGGLLGEVGKLCSVKANTPLATAFGTQLLHKSRNTCINIRKGKRHSFPCA
jgi:hypothetical protein